MVRNAQAVAETSPYFGELTVGLLRRLVSSQDLVATEFERLCIVRKWMESSDDDGRKDNEEMESLLSCIRLELMDLSERDQVSLALSSGRPSLLWKMIHRNMSSAVTILSQISQKIFGGILLGGLRSRDLNRFSICFPILSFLPPLPAFGSTLNPVHCFLFNNWVWSAHFSNRAADKLDVVLNALRRERSEHMDISFDEESRLFDNQVTGTVISASREKIPWWLVT